MQLRLYDRKRLLSQLQCISNILMYGPLFYDEKFYRTIRVFFYHRDLFHFLCIDKLDKMLSRTTKNHSKLII